MKSIISVSLFLVLAIAAKAQTPDQSFIPRILPNAPNTAALGRFGDYQVNYFTGVPAISIPLYTISITGMEIPISLNYHASGVKVSDFASFVGLGWGLDAGGSIRRKMVGKPDEGAAGFLMGQTRELNEIDPATVDGEYYLNLVSTGMIDTEPDIYSYNFPSHSGKFFFNREDGYKPVNLPYAPVKVNKHWNSSAAENLWFDVLDEMGNYFHFGETVRESTSSNYGGMVTAGISAWMLEKVISSNKADTVFFSYADQGSLVADDYVDTWVVNDKHYLASGETPAYLPNSQASLTNINSSAIVSEKAISEIRFRNGKIVFELTAANRQDFGLPGAYDMKALSKIRVYNRTPATDQYQLLKTVVFFQSYFIDGSNALTKRLRLDSLQVRDAEDVVSERYRFDYNQTVKLPVRYAKSRDYWGYFNGKANSLLIPRTDIIYFPGTNTGGAATTETIGSNVPNSREPDPAYMQAAVLKRIYYPTRGFTDFEYETNQYKDENGNTRYGGGLRIKSIKSYESTNATPVVKTFTYGDLESGMGRANFFLRNYFTFAEQFYQRFETHTFTLTEEIRVRSFFSNPTIEVEAYDGAVVVYPTVTEYAGDQTTNAGKVVYKFTDQLDVSTTASYVKPTIRSYFYARGQLTNKTVYKRLPTGAYQPVEAESFVYSAFPETIYKAGLVANRTVYPNYVFAPDENDPRTWIFDTYTIDSDDNYPILKTKTLFDPQNPSISVTTSTQLSYGNIAHQQPTEITTTTSIGNTTKTRNKYPADYIPSGGTQTNNAVLDAMLAKNMQAIAIENWNTLTKPGDIEKVTAGQLHLYKVLSPGVVVPDLKKHLNITTGPLSDFQPSAVSGTSLVNDSRYVNMIKFDSYDAAKNLSQFTIKTKTPSAYLWDYRGKWPIAEIKYATVAHTAYTSFEAEGKGNWTFAGPTSAQADAPTGKMAYQLSGGALSKSGLTAATVYIVSYWTKNASAYTITGTQAGYPLTGRSVGGWNYFEHRITGQTTVSISGSGLIDEVRLYPATAQMVTMTHEPLVGITSQCDAANRITYYEYDGFGRLMLVRDQDKNIVKTMEYNYKK